MPGSLLGPCTCHTCCQGYRSLSPPGAQIPPAHSGPLPWDVTPTDNCTLPLWPLRHWTLGRRSPHVSLPYHTTNSWGLQVVCIWACPHGPGNTSGVCRCSTQEEEGIPPGRARASREEQSFFHPGHRNRDRPPQGPGHFSIGHRRKATGCVLGATSLSSPGAPESNGWRPLWARGPPPTSRSLWLSLYNLGSRI